MKEGWEYIALSSVCKVQNGFAFNSKLFNESNNGLPLIRIRDIKRGYSLTYTSEICSDEFFVEDGDMLIGMDGDFNIGEWKGGHALLNQRVCKLIPSEKILAKFIFYFIPEALQKINDKTAFSTVKHLSSKQVNAILLPNLPLSEQQSIVDYLDSAFAKIDAMKANAEKALIEAKALFQASLKEMLEPKEGWEEKYLKDIAEYSIGLTYKPTDVCDNGTIVLRSSNIQEGKLDLNDIVKVNTSIKEKLYVQCGDILMCSRNGSARLVGKVCIIPELKERMTYGTFMMVIRSAYNPLLYHYFDTDLFRRQIKHGEANMINQITRYMLDEVKLNLPPIKEQQSIVETLDSLKSKVDRLQENYEKISQECDALKQAILRQVFE